MDSEADIAKKLLSRRRRALLRFKALTRRVIENSSWLKEEHINEMAAKAGTKVKTGQLTFAMRIALYQQPDDRTDEQIDLIVGLLMTIKDIKRFEFQFADLAKYVEYQLVKSPRVIIQAGHPAEFLYAIVGGDVKVESFSPKTGEVARSQLHAGSLFGDFALLYNQTRAATISAMNNVELLKFNKYVFDLCIRDALLSHYYLMNQAMKNFQYFANFDKYDLTTLCFYGRVNQYEDGDILYTNEHAREVTFFVIEGACDLIELLRVNRIITDSGKEIFVEYNPMITARKSVGRPLDMGMHILKSLALKERKSIKTPKYSVFSQATWTHSQSEELSSTTMLAKRFKPPSSMVPKSYTYSISEQQRVSKPRAEESDTFRISSGTGGFESADQSNYAETHKCRKLILDVLTHPDETPDPFMLNKYLISNKVPPYESHFMKIATFYKSSCINVGENLHHRYVVANGKMIVLEIPKKTLARQKYIIWEKVRRTLDRSVPNSAMVFSKFVKDRMYRQYKKSLISNVLTGKDLAKSGNVIHYVPYSIRIRQDFDFTDEYHRWHSQREEF